MGLHDIGTDVFQYHEIAIQWLKGNFILNSDPYESYQFFRPVFYILNALSLAIFGVNDWSFSLLLSILDTFSSMIIFFTIYKITNSRLLSLTGMLMYIINPVTLSMAQAELPHTASAFFVTLSLYFLIAYFTQQLENHLYLAGIFSACASLTHGSLLFFFSSKILILFLFHFEKQQEKNLEAKIIYTIKNSSAYIFSYLSTYLIFSLITGPAQSLFAFLSLTRVKGNTENLISIFNYYINETIGPLYTIELYLFFIFCILFSLLLKAINKSQTTKLIGILFFIINLKFLIVMRQTSIRFHLPLVPVFIVSFLSLINLIIKHYKIYRNFNFLTIIIPITILITYSINHFNSYKIHYFKKPSWYKTLHNALKDKTDISNKLLIAPSITTNHRREFANELYFGNNAKYLKDCHLPGLNDFIEKNNIKFLLIANKPLLKSSLINLSKRRNSPLGKCFGMTPQTYNLESELERIRDFISAKKAKLIFNDTFIGKVYEL